jgi:hypothetical protein
VVAVLLSALLVDASGQKASAKFRGFSHFEVVDFENGTTGNKEPMPDGWLPMMKEDIAQRVIELHKFRHVSDYEDAKAPAPGAERVIVLKGRITEYTRGSQAARYLIGFGAGKGKIVVQCQFVDKTTGEVLLDRKVDGRVIGFGQSTEGAIQGVSKEIKKVVDDNW